MVSMVYDCRQMFDIISLDVELPEKCKSKNCVAEGFLRCSYEFTSDDNEQMTVEYTLTASDDEDAPYGICAVLRDSRRKIIDRSCVHRKYSTLTECAVKMRMLAKDTVLPSILEYIL